MFVEARTCACSFDKLPLSLGVLVVGFLVYRASFSAHASGSIGALIITHTVLGVPYYIYNIVGPKTLFCLLRALYWPLAGEHAGAEEVMP